MKIFKPGDKIKLGEGNSRFSRLSKLKPNQIYTVKEFHKKSTDYIDDVVILKELKNDCYYEGYIPDRFDLYIDADVQDNEFVKMMSCNERMLDI